MFDFSRIAHHARRWREARKHTELESLIHRLPVELQKDIGWPAPMDDPSAGKVRHDIHARPIL